MPPLSRPWSEYGTGSKSESESQTQCQIRVPIPISPEMRPKIPLYIILLTYVNQAYEHAPQGERQKDGDKAEDPGQIESCGTRMMLLLMMMMVMMLLL